jgi:hypothetical protein
MMGIYPLDIEPLSKSNVKIILLQGKVIVMKKIATVACLVLSSIGFSVASTSALAVNNVADIESPAVSSGTLQKTLAVNVMMVEKNVISLSKGRENAFKISKAKTEQEVQSIYNDLVYILSTHSFYK